MLLGYGVKPVAQTQSDVRQKRLVPAFAFSQYQPPKMAIQPNFVSDGREPDPSIQNWANDAGGACRPLCQIARGRHRW